MQIIFNILGGLALFLYGLDIISKALKKASVPRVKVLIDKLTKSVFIAIILGFVITALVQSSSATTVLLVGLINAGIISFKNTVGIIFGANIGTTITVQIIAFKLSKFIYPALALGVFLKIFFKRKYKILSNGLIGFALIFLGLELMKNGVAPLKEYKPFMNFIASLGGASFGSLVLGLLVSMIFTAMIQASGATIAILITLVSLGMLSDLRIAIPIILGAKLGTCITAFFASLNSVRDGKRIALMHFIFNVVASVLTLIFIDYFILLAKYSSDDLVRQIANLHTLISIVAVFVLLPFSNYLVLFIEKLMPIKDTEMNRKNFFDYNLLDTPSLAIASLNKSVIYMGTLVKEMLKQISSDNKNITNVYDLESQVDLLQDNVKHYVLALSEQELDGEDAIAINKYREIGHGLERVADHIENIVDNAVCLKDWTIIFNNESIKELSEYVSLRFNKVLKIMQNGDIEGATDLLDEKYKERAMFKEYAAKLNEIILSKKIETNSAILISDTIHNMKRISYHLRRVLKSVVVLEETDDQDNL